MVIWVKTTIDIASGLMAQAKERARSEKTTLRALIERGLYRVLSEPPPSEYPPFKPVTGRLEPLPGVDPDDWKAMEASIYEEDDDQNA